MMLEGAQSVVLSPVPLWLLVALPLLGGIVAGFGKSEPRASSPRLIAPLVVTILLALVLSVLAGEGALITPLFRLFRVGTLDLHWMLALDRFDALVVAAVATSALLLHLRQAASSSEGISVTSIGLATTAAVVAVLSSSIAGVLMGIGVLLVAVVASKAGAETGRVILEAHARALPLVIGGFIVLFWSLGGRFLDERLFFSDFGARFSVLGEGAPAESIRGDERGTLTITTHPGAKIYLGITNEAQISAQPFGVSPLVRADLPAGLHKVAIAPGDGSVVGGEGLEIALVDAVRIPKNGDVTLGVVGSTVSYDEIARQIAPGSDALGDKRMGPFRARALAAGLVAASLIVLSLSLLRLPARASHGAAWLAAIPLIVFGDLLREVRLLFDGARFFPSVAAIALVAILIWIGKSRLGRAPEGLVAAAGFATLALLVATGAAAFAPAVGVAACFGSLLSSVAGGNREKLYVAARGGLGVFGIAMGLAVAAGSGIFGSNGALGLGVTLAALALAFTLAQTLRPESAPDPKTRPTTKKSKSAPAPPPEAVRPSTPQTVAAALAILIGPTLLFFTRSELSTLGPIALVAGVMTLGAALLSERLPWAKPAVTEPSVERPSLLDALGRVGDLLHALCGGSFGGAKK